MKKVAFLIPGFKETPARPGLTEISTTLQEKGWEVKKVSITVCVHEILQRQISF